MVLGQFQGVLWAFYRESVGFTGVPGVTRLRHLKRNKRFQGDFQRISVAFKEFQKRLRASYLSGV